MDTQPLNKELIERDVANIDYYSSLAGLDNPVKEKETAIRSDLENDFYKLTYNQMVDKYGVDATNAIYQNFGNAGAQ